MVPGKVKLFILPQLKFEIERQGSGGQSILIVPELAVVFAWSIRKYSVTPLVSDTVVIVLLDIVQTKAHVDPLQD